MKKFIYVIIAIIIACLGYLGYNYYSSNNSNKTDTDTIVSDSVEMSIPVAFGEGNPVDTTTYDFTNVINADAEWCTMHCPNTSCNYYETTMVLNDNVDVLDSSSVKIKAIKNVFQCGNQCVMFMHNVGGVGVDPVIEVYNDYYMECLPIELPIALSLGSMINKLNECNYPKPASNVCVIRKQLIPPFDGPYYIVGTVGTGFLKVRTSDGLVTAIQ